MSTHGPTFLPRDAQAARDGDDPGPPSPAIDVSDHRLTLRALADSERRFRTLVTNLPGAVYRCALDDRWTMSFLSDFAERITGYPAADFLGPAGRNFAELIHPDDDARNHVAVAQAVARRAPFNIEYRLRHADGSERWVYEAGQVQFDAAGDPLWLDGVMFDVTDHRRADTALRDREHQLQLALEAARMGSWAWDIRAGRIECGPDLERLFGLAPGTFDGTVEAFYALVHPDDRARVRDTLARAVRREPTDGVEYRVPWPDGTVRWILSRGRVFFDDRGRPQRVVGIDLDITDRKQTAETLAASEQFARATVDALTAHVAILDARGTILAVNNAWRDFAAANPPTPPDAFIGRDYLATCDAAAAAGGSDAPDAAAVAAGIRAVLAREADAFVREYSCHSPAEQRWFVVRASRFAGDGPVRAVVAHENVTQRRLAEARLQHDSLHDALTGLPNRVLFRDRVERCLTRARRRPGGYHFAVLFLDLDRFKLVNDSLGHAAGDQLLVSVAARLRTCLRATDSAARGAASAEVARMGGDEFTVLLDDLRDPADAAVVAERVVAALGRPYDVAGQEVTATASVGIALGGPAYAAPEDLLRDADAAMYEAKAAGKCRYALFDATMHASVVARLRLESDLRRAVERGELLLHFQPIVSLQTGALAGFEALVRWCRGDQLVSPAQFIPIAEDTGLIVPIGRWVLGEACRQLAAWRAACPGLANAGISVNVSRRQLADPGFVADVAAALGAIAVEPAAVRLEVTESVVMGDEGAARQTLERLKSLGVRLALDDFGTGYSSLGCLHQFPIDIVKIDRSFIASLTGKAHTGAVTSAIVSLAHHLGMTVVAEGVETADQVAYLQGLDCDFGQGYFFARPLPAADVVQRYGAAPTTARPD